MKADNGSLVRFTHGVICPVCGGCEEEPRGQGKRCFGFIRGEWIHCTREEYAKGCRFHEESESFSHRLYGECKCGVIHNASLNGDTHKRIEKVYQYLDEVCKVVHETVRFEGKIFKQRRSAGAGEYIWSLKGITPILYNIPGLTADLKSVVWIVEGEKDADNLIHAGRLATCNPMGALKWHARYSETLRGRHCRIIPDNDDKGREHARRVAESLRGKAASVRIVYLPGLPEHGDVSDWLKAGHKVTELDELGIADEGEPERKLETIVITELEADINDLAIRALANHPEVYQRNLTLVSVAFHIKANQAGRIRFNREDGTPLVRPIQAARLREILSRVAEWKRWVITRQGESELKSAHPPEWSYKAIIAREEWPEIRYLLGIVEIPTLRPDGSVIQTKGYDHQTGLLYIPSGIFPPIPDHPGKEEANAAAKRLLDLVKDFPFKKGHDAAWLSALLTIVGRFLIDGPVPMFMFEANTSGAGKTLLADLLAIIATGREMTRTGYYHDPIEMDKQITATALAGDPVVLFDNIDNGGSIGNSALDRALTARTYRGRILGKSEMTPDLDLICVFICTGNNLALCGDIPRRIVPCRLESLIERPEERGDFAIKDLKGHALANRAELVIAALTILKAFIEAEKPDQKLTPMDFPAWTMLIRNAVHWAIDLDPAIGRKDLRASDPERQGCIALAEGWLEVQGDKNQLAMTSREMLKAVRDAPEDKFETIRNAFVALWPKTKAGELPSSNSIGMKIQMIRDKPFDGKRFRSMGDEKRAKLWGVEVIPGLDNKSESGDSSESPGVITGQLPFVQMSKMVITRQRLGETHQTHQTHFNHAREEPDSSGHQPKPAYSHELISAIRWLSGMLCNDALPRNQFYDLANADLIDRAMIDQAAQILNVQRIFEDGIEHWSVQ